jgi:acetyl-CoA acetyltransferase
VGTFGGGLRAVPVEELAATAIKAVLERTGIDPEIIDDVCFAQSYVNGETPCIGRWAALHAGLPVSVPGLQIDRRCGGGLQAVVTAAMMVQTGAADVVLAGGAESMSNAEHYTTSVRWGARGVRPDSTPETLAKLRTIMPGGTVTAGNASQQNDAAAACLVVAEDRLGPLGLEPLGYLAGWAAAGCEPATMGIGPVPAVEKLFSRTGLAFPDIDLIELNEAFAVQVLAVLAGWGWNEPDKLNVNGSGISLGHPIGATGARMLATGLRELRRRNGRYLLETMCVGGGQGMAAVFEAA